MRRTGSRLASPHGLCVMLMLTGALLLPCPSARCDDGASVQNTTERKVTNEQRKRAEEQDPADQLILQLETGYLADFRRGERDRGYYRVEYKGKTISQSGDPITVPGAENVTRAKGSAQTGDVHNLSLLLDQGAIGLSSGILDLLGVQPLNLGSLGDWIRGTLRVAGSLRHQRLSISGGIETKPIRFLNRLTCQPEDKVNRQRIANYLVLGFAGNQQNTEDDPGGSGDTVDTVIATYRAGLSRAWDWRISQRGVAARRRLASKIMRVLREEGAQSLLRAETPQRNSTAAKMEAVQNDADLTPLERVVRRTLRESSLREFRLPLDRRKTADLRDEVENNLAEDDATGAPDQWTMRVEAGVEGWYTLSGPIGVRRHQSSLFAALDYVPNPKAAERFSIQARYENGFLRASPYQRVHSFKIVARIGF